MTERQTDHVYKAVEEGNMINTKTVMCETAQIQDDNPYKKVILNKVFKEQDKSPEMRNWSIFSDNVRYVQHDQAMPQSLNIDTLDYRDHKELYLKLNGEEREMLVTDKNDERQLRSKQRKDSLSLDKGLLQENY